jgi:hypothetical protein
VARLGGRTPSGSVCSGSRRIGSTTRGTSYAIRAIRAIRAGTPYELVARQLGHANIAMVAQVYGRFAPRSDERDRWERIAALQDEKQTPMRTAGGTALGGALGQVVANQQHPNASPSTFIIRH